MFNNRLENTQPPPTVALADKVRQLKIAGKDVIGLQTGDPDFGTPRSIMEAAYEAMRNGQTHYCDSKGLPVLRQAIVAKCLSFNSVAYDPDKEVYVTNGGIHGYYCTLQALCNPGDEVLIPDPTWPTHLNVASVCGARPVQVPASAENNFCPNISDWESRLTPATRLMVINYPSNPTGAMPEEAYLLQLAAFAEKHDLTVVSDEVYEHITFDDRKAVHFASLPGMKERTVTLFSTSKSYAMTGWRLGYITAPEAVIHRIQKIGQLTVTNASSFAQAGLAKVMNSAGLALEVEQMRRAYEQRSRMSARILSMGGIIGFNVPQGAFYYFLDFRKLGLPSDTIAEKLLNEAGVGMVPGLAYGHMGEGFLRMTIAASSEEIEKGLSRTLEWASAYAHT